MKNNIFIFTSMQKPSSLDRDVLCPMSRRLEVRSSNYLVERKRWWRSEQIRISSINPLFILLS